MKGIFHELLKRLDDEAVNIRHADSVLFLLVANYGCDVITGIYD